jgi:hypothetical protein
MKKLLTTNHMIGLVALCLIGVYFYSFNTPQAFLFTVVTAVVWFLVIDHRKGKEYTQKTFNQPFTLSMNDAGKTFAVEDINDNRIGLVTYGPDSNSDYLARATYLSYYWINDFPEEVRNVGAVIQVTNTSSGLSFRIREDVHGGNYLIPVSPQH